VFADDGLGVAGWVKDIAEDQFCSFFPIAYKTDLVNGSEVNRLRFLDRTLLLKKNTHVRTNPESRKLYWDGSGTVPLRDKLSKLNSPGTNA